MKIIVIGLGSMGKRRIRCLKALGHNNIIGFDNRLERCIEASAKYNIETYDDIEKISLNVFDLFIISTPPEKHTFYLKLALKYNKPAFVEASVLIEDLEEINDIAIKKQLYIAPSCTLKFHPVIRDIKSIISSRTYGNVTNFIYHSGNYLPDWHPWEKVTDFYVSNRETGGAREIVPFELTWICDLFGFPNEIKGHFLKTMDVGADIEDSYSFSLKYPRTLGSLMVDVVARYSMRNLIINFEFGQILWRWDDNFMEVYDAKLKRWITYNQPVGESELGYNKNILEDMYIDEMDAFIKGLTNPNEYPNNLDDDIRVLKLLYKLENSDGGF